MIFKKLQGTIREERENERLRATVQEQAALLEYVALMTDVELPTMETETAGAESGVVGNE